MVLKSDVELGNQSIIHMKSTLTSWPAPLPPSCSLWLIQVAKLSASGTVIWDLRCSLRRKRCPLLARLLQCPFHFRPLRRFQSVTDRYYCAFLTTPTLRSCVAYSMSKPLVRCQYRVASWTYPSSFSSWASSFQMMPARLSDWTLISWRT